MTKTLFISDTHFSHQNVLKFSANERPFNTIEEHDAELITRWNSRVGINDKIIHLGDVCFKPATRLDPIMSQLNGIKHLLLGNHDTAPMENYLKWFDKVGVIYQDRRAGILYSHYPVHPSQLEHRYKYNVHGHCHQHVIKDDPRYLNICVEHTGLYPITREEIIARLHEQNKDV